MNTETRLPADDIGKQARFLRALFSRLSRLLEIVSEGYVIVLTEAIDGAYIRLSSSLAETLRHPGFEILQESCPDFPESLHSLGEELDTRWELSLKPDVVKFKGQILRFCIESGIVDNNDEEFDELFKSIDSTITSYREMKLEEEKKLMAKGSKWAENLKAQFIAKASSPILAVQRKKDLIEGLNKLLNDFTTLKSGTEFLQSEGVEWYEADKSYIEAVRSWDDHVEAVLGIFGRSDVLQTWKMTKKSDLTVVGIYDYAERRHTLLKQIKSAVESEKEETEPVVGEFFSLSIVGESKDYIRNIAAQANGCYEKGWYDACAVMTRRLIEVLIIDCFDAHNIFEQIKDADGEVISLGRLVEKFLEEPNGLWHIERSAKPALRQMKKICDAAAHGRYYKTQRQSLDKYKESLEIAVQQLVGISGRKL